MANQILFTALLFLVFTSFLNSQALLQEAFPNLAFTRPIDLQHAGDGTDRIFIVEQEGIIKVFPNSGSVASASTFLDIRSIVRDGGEKGLLGLAFHPDYETNGYFYVHYTDGNPLISYISRFNVSSTDSNSADENSKLVLLSINQPANNHNGGWVGFGPDGYLYMAIGEGGHSSNLPKITALDDNAQDITNLLGAILRIDVDNQDIGLQYAIPSDNPFVDSTGNEKKEIYAWGFRNPWRGSFDPVTGRLWLGDVGQFRREEIDIIEKGKNYGWGCYEGNRIEDLAGCNYPEYVFPVWEYSHNPGDACAVMGGYVYRGTNIPGLVGKYIYGDYCIQTVWSLEIEPNTVNQTLLTVPDGLINSFGVDQSGELYVLTINPPNIYMFINDPLPVELINFNGEYINNQVRIAWETATEIMNYGFDLERTVSSDGWKKIEFIPGNGNSNSPKYYNYTDNDILSTGIFKYRLKQINNNGSFEYSEEISVNVNEPGRFLLKQNYPNPFNPSTLIKFYIPVSSNVKLKLFNMLGQEVAELINANIAAGIHKFELNAENLSSGTYFYFLEVNGENGEGFFDIKKMVLLK
ncbi:MAG: PQQ-dependent sugar dehydrogenase [Ignavibacteria bacterium]|nr:PQQ-dependent sugar dehydrogenase [Ignavibacteria bacterium]